MATNYTLQDAIRGSCEGSDKFAPGLVEFMKSSDEPTYVNLTGHANLSLGWM